MDNTAVDKLMAYLAWLRQGSVSAETAAALNAARAPLVADLTGATALRRSCADSKWHTGGLAPGCRVCADGAWSCYFVNDGVCTARCFFCPMDLEAGRAAPGSAENITFTSPDAYVAYLDQLGFRGVSFSGGEPLLSFDRVLTLLTAVKHHFGAAMTVWLYTNGDLLNATRLAQLRSAGLDEIRINIRARNYKLDAVRRARRFLPTVSVEIPAVPEEVETLLAVLPQLADCGVDHLNLHQLIATQHNYQRLARHAYTYLPPAAFREAPVAESELAALTVLRHAVATGYPVPVNYCSHVYKARFQNWAYRLRAAALARVPDDVVTAAGYLRRGSGADARYFEADVVAEDGDMVVRRLRLTARQSVYVERRPVGGPEAAAWCERLDHGLQPMVPARTLLVTGHDDKR